MDTTNKNYVLCEHCNSIILATKFTMHSRKAHKIILYEFDLDSKIRVDKEKIEKLREMASEKTKKKGKKVSLLMRSEFESNVIKYNEIRAKIDLDKKINNKSYYLTWDDISFEKNKVKFSPNRINSILQSVELKGVFQELNNIKEEYFKRLFYNEVYKLNFYKSRLLISESPDWQRILKKIEVGKQFFEFKSNKTYKLSSGLSVNEALTIHKSIFAKSTYLKYLASIQDKDFKLIPIIETVSDSDENSFLFRIQSKSNKILILWENVNENRATHVFMSTIESHSQTLSIIESFICTRMVIKRSLLYYKDIENISMKNELGYLTTIRHESLSNYKAQIRALVEKT